MAGDEFEEFRAEYRRGLPEKIAQMDAAWAAVENGSADAAQLQTLLRVLHSMAGSARTFGIEGLSEAAAVAESAFEPWCERGALPAPSERPEFGRMLEAVRRTAAG